jgi:hypothetical protein
VAGIAFESRIVRGFGLIRRSVGLVVAVGALAILAAPSAAWASAGCDAVNAGGLNFAVAASSFASRIVNGRFNNGDLITISFAATGSNTNRTLQLQFINGSGGNVFKLSPVTGDTLSLTSSGAETSIRSEFQAGAGGSGTDTVTGSCTPGPAASTTTSLQSSSNPSVFGQSVTLTATVTGNSPTGTVQFKDGATSLGMPVTLSSGAASLTTMALTPGGHNITAVYSGDTDNIGSTSSMFTQTVNQAATSTGLLSSINPSAAGQSSTFTATVTVLSPGAGTPTGTVTFFFGDGLSSTVNLTGSTAGSAHSYAVGGTYTVTAVYGGDGNFSGSNSSNLSQQVTTVSSTAVTSSLNPSAFGQSVTLTATVTGNSPTGTVQFKDGATSLGTPVTLSSGAASLTTMALTPGGHNITAVYSGDTNNVGSTSPMFTQTVNQATSSTAVTSSLNPSQAGQAVTFTAAVTSGGGTPTGTVTFKDGAAVLGTGTLAGGIASFTTASLTLGSHTITAVYGGSASFTGSTSSALIQAVSTPADSLKLRAMQVLAAPVEAQASGQAISGAVDAAISEGFSDGGMLVTPDGNGVRFNFAADPDAKPTETVAHVIDPFSSVDGSSASGRGFAGQPSAGGAPSSRIGNAFDALAYAGPTKAQPPLRYVEQRDWLGWAEVQGAVLDRWGSGTGVVGTVAGVPMLYGNQVNMLAGLTRRVLPNFLVGVLGGYETFDYRSDALQGRLKGDGWTVGSYLGWKITQSIRFDAAVAYSGIGYDGSAGIASGSFGGNRWLVSSGLTGSYRNGNLLIEPSARVYALWEHENAYTDSLGTAQADRDFSTGRASAGVKVTYPLAWSSTVALAPYVGVYSDYYFNTDSATAVVGSGIPAAVVLDGWSARANGGVTAKFGGGAQLSVGAERSGIGDSFGFWTYRARASVPF